MEGAGPAGAAGRAAGAPEEGEEGDADADFLLISQAPAGRTKDLGGFHMSCGGGGAHLDLMENALMKML